MLLLLFSLVIGIIIVVGLFYLLRQLYNPPSIDFHDRHVIVTEGSNGIGKSLVKSLLIRGANVTILARNEQHLCQCESELKSISDNRLLSLSVDVSLSYENVEQSICRACEKQGPVTVLINNAGIYDAKSFDVTKPVEFEKMIRINYLSAIYCTKACRKYMYKMGYGQIVLVSSQARQLDGYTSYCSTKFALRGLAEALQMELARSNIYVTTIYPPHLDTPEFTEENKSKPVETQLISQTSSIVSTDLVAENIIKQTLKGSFACWFSINGFLLTYLTSGTSSMTTLLESIYQVTFVGLARLIAITLFRAFYSIVRNNRRQSSSTH
ncbi:unnamed protein product [Didymodactylos carnosus]|uniref:3-dehydrosphinganine reductase n=1 Tax=Didymodactylos carnosus TaxID=1234261 RepID=A0A814R315_9BILA|nr:unnamed protein product [Didymodactylos carnosus]CAF1127613.1 unnamed protein product [Didymodactylos carnosus]CAF3660759.1 unnamed protein product [Didymodactylos carnosus]CAF3891153.1 unnamed protein product [Didymodactylos carnosus]